MPGERGIALITVLLVVAIASALASHIVWRQQVWTRQVENLRDAAQGQAVARAGVDWAGLILAEDRRRNQVDHLNESWATPVAVPVEYGRASGALADMQGRFNLNNLVRDGQVSLDDVAAFQRLLILLELPPELADALVDWLDADGLPHGSHGAEDAWYLALDPPGHAANQPLADVAELSLLRGYTHDIVARLAPHVAALPGFTPVNVNTATAPVLAALLPALTLEQARRLVAERGDGWRSPEALRAELGPAQWAGAREAALTAASDYFQLTLEVEFGRVRQRHLAIYRRTGHSAPDVLWAKRL